MFPEAFAAKWIERLTEPGDTVLDPFCGRGTAPFQALLMDRRAVGNDVNPVAYVVTRAKTNGPRLAALRGRMTVLERDYCPTEWDDAIERLPEFFKVAFDSSTLRQIIYLSNRLRWRSSDVDCMIAAIVLGALHGESSRSTSYLSNQMPRTISTKPAYSVRFWHARNLVAPKRDAFKLIRDRLAYRYVSDPPTGKALVINGDMRELHLRHLPRDIQCVITSPPYLDVTNFEEDQWLRLWFLGGPPRPTKGLYSRDDRHESRDGYWMLIGDMWRMLGQVLAPSSHVVMRIGAKGLTPDQIVQGLTGVSVYARRRIALMESEVSEIRGRQTRAFRPGSAGVLYEVDCLFSVG
jgi:hypothetical protein